MPDVPSFYYRGRCGYTPDVIVDQRGFVGDTEWQFGMGFCDPITYLMSPPDNFTLLQLQHFPLAYHGSDYFHVTDIMNVRLIPGHLDAVEYHQVAITDGDVEYLVPDTVSVPNAYDVVGTIFVMPKPLLSEDLCQFGWSYFNVWLPPDSQVRIELLPAHPHVLGGEEFAPYGNQSRYRVQVTFWVRPCLSWHHSCPQRPYQQF